MIHEYAEVPEACAVRLLTKRFNALKAAWPSSREEMMECVLMWGGSCAEQCMIHFDPRRPCNASFALFQERKGWFLNQVWAKWLKQKMFQNKLQIPNTLQISNALLEKMEGLAAQTTFKLPPFETEYLADVLSGLRYLAALKDHSKLVDSAYMDAFMSVTAEAKESQRKKPVAAKKPATFSETVGVAVLSSPHWREMHDELSAVDQALMEGLKRVRDAEDELTANTPDLTIQVGEGADKDCTSTISFSF